MAKFEITHACGHTVTHNIVGTNVNDERNRKAAWLAGQPCQECGRAAEVSTAAAATTDLPALTGSEKQIAWATTIRATAKAAVDALLDGKPLTPAQSTAVDALWGTTDASWWIDNRVNGDIAIGWLREASKLVR